MSFEMKGKIKKIFDQQDFPSGFYKRDFVITTEDQYPQDVKFTATKERTEQIAKYNEGDAVLVKFDIRGREYNGNFYVDLNAWRVEPGQGGAPAAPAASGVSAAPLPDVPPMAASGDDEDDLPF
jgi:hypothetical protein